MKISMKEARGLAKLTQSEVAEKMGLHMMTIWKWENGKVLPKTAQFKMYCKIIGMPEKNVERGHYGR